MPHLEGRRALGGADERQQVVAEGVGDVLGEVGVGALAGHEGLDPEAEHGDCVVVGVVVVVVVVGVVVRLVVR